MEHIGLYLKHIHFNKESGRLIFNYKDIQKYLFFEDGFLVFTKTNQPSELLGEFLFRMKKIPEDVYTKIDQYIEPMQSIGKILVRSGIIDKKDLHAGLMYQMRETVLNMFPIFKGDFKFQEKSGFAEGEFGTRINVLDLIEEGISRRMSYKMEIKKFLEKKVLIPKTKDCIERLTIKERELLGMIDGKHTGASLLSSTKFRARPFWKSLYLFYCLNLIGFPDEKISMKKEKVAEVAPDDSERRLAEVLAISNNLPRLDYYSLLNVSSSASPSEIKMAYFNMARKYHPDRFDHNLPQETKIRIEEVFSQISRAYDALILGKQSLRAEPSKVTPPADEKMDPEKKAEMKYRHAKFLYNQEKYQEALISIEEALRLKRNKGSYVLLLAKIEMKTPAFKRKAEEDFLKAIDLEPWNVEAYISLGNFYKEVGLPVKAAKVFRKVLEMEPDNKVARQELGMEKPKKKGIKEFLHMGVLSKKKKEEGD
jgi:tetratricopeptide (TPR) repeat protein